MDILNKGHAQGRHVLLFVIVLFSEARDLYAPVPDGHLLAVMSYQAR